MRFVNLLSKLIPKHFLIHPKQINVFLDESIDNLTTEKFKYISSNITPTDESIPFSMSDNNDILKSQGIVKIDDEYIKYDTKDLTTESLLNLERGFLGSESVSHCISTLWTAQLSQEIDEFTTTIVLTRISNISAIPRNGKMIIYTDTLDIEEIVYSSYNQWLNGAQFTGVTRGSGGTTAKKHPQGSLIKEYATPLITQVNTIKYDKGIFTVNLLSDITITSTEIPIQNVFYGKLLSSIVSTDNGISIYDIVGAIPKNGLIKIGSEVIRYGKYEVSETTPNTGFFSKLTRGFDSTSKISHTADDIIYFTVQQTGEIQIDDEYIYYAEYDPIYNKFKQLTRGFYSSIIDSHVASTIITQRKNVEFDKSGLIKIDNEYFKYWYVDDEYFYVDSRPSFGGGNYYYTTTGTITTVVESHDDGSVISTYYFPNDNSYLIDFLHAISEHMDIALSASIDKLDDFSDVDKISLDYLNYLVKEVGEDLDDYQNLQFFSGSNREKRIKLFTKELISIYRQKGLVSALKLWHTVISQPLESYQDLWTFNYASFYSLPFLCLILYEGSKSYYPNENFLKPQISPKLFDELSYFYRNKKLYGYPIYDLKLKVLEWDYFQMTDDDVKASNGGSFDDRIVSGDSINDLSIYYDPTKVYLSRRSAPGNFNLPFNVEDYDLDLFKFEEQLDAEKENFDDPDLHCFPIAFDYSLLSDELSDWIHDTSTDNLFDYCDSLDKLFPIKCDINLLKDYSSDLGNAKIELVDNVTKTDTEITVKLIEGKLYSPKEHIASGSNPKILPKGYIKINDEIISYTDIEFFDEHDGTFINKKYRLLGCTRGANNTTAAEYKVNVYEGYENILYDQEIEEIKLSHQITCTVDITNNLLIHLDHGLLTDDVVVFDVGNGAGVIANTYYLVTKINTNQFRIRDINTGVVIVIGSNTVITAKEIHFRLILHRDPINYNINIGDSLQLIQSGYNHICDIVNIYSEYNYCSETHEYGIDFHTIYPPSLVYHSLSYETTYDCTINDISSNISYVSHGFSDSDIIYFLKGVGNIEPFIDYYVVDSHPDYFKITNYDGILAVTANAVTNKFTSAVAHNLNEGDNVVFTLNACGVIKDFPYTTINITSTTFQILDSNNNIVDLTAGVNNFWSYINLSGLKEINNTFMQTGTRVISTIDAYQHRYSMIQHLLWRLENEINGNDLELTYGLSTSLLTNYKLDNYNGLKDSNIWPTPHFKFGFSVTTDGTDAFPPDEIVRLVLKKLKEYKPKHTVADVVFSYSLDGMQLGFTPLNENFETENLMSDAYTVAESDPLEYHIELIHDPITGIIDYEYDIPIVEIDSPTDYGQLVSFYYTVHLGTPEELAVYYGPFFSYPYGVQLDSYRRRKRHFGRVEN